MATIPSTDSNSPPVTPPQAVASPAPPQSTPAKGMPVPAHALGKVRSPISVWALSLVTCGIYGLVWYYKVNSELRDYDARIIVSPGRATLATTLGACVVIPAVMSWMNTGGRIAKAQELAGVPVTCSGTTGLLLSFVVAMGMPYYQSQLNLVWAAHTGSAAA
jgi:hypothetical protein